MTAPIADINAARRRKDEADALAYAPGVVPFDRTNPAHVRAWNTLFRLGWQEQRSTNPLPAPIPPEGGQGWAAPDQCPPLRRGPITHGEANVAR